jgi:SMI1-KNR4 cell-wall
MFGALLDKIYDHITDKRISIQYPPASEEVIVKAEKSLGFELPQLLRAVYKSIGNGGFGPAYGIIGVEGGHAANLGTLVETYREIQAGAEYGGFTWQEGLLPFCEWGCNIFSCVDCLDKSQPIFRSDECVARPQKFNIEAFFMMWIDGVSILDVNAPPKKYATIINPFTRKPTRVVGIQKDSKPPAKPRKHRI